MNSIGKKEGDKNKRQHTSGKKQNAWKISKRLTGMKKHLKIRKKWKWKETEKEREALWKCWNSNRTQKKRKYVIGDIEKKNSKMGFAVRHVPSRYFSSLSSLPLPLSMPEMPNVPGYQACRSDDSFHPSSYSVNLSLFLFFCLSLYLRLAMSVLYISVRPSVRLFLSVSSCLFLSLCFSVILSLYACLSFSAFHKYFLSTLFVFCFYLFCTFIWLFIFGQVFSFSFFFFLCQFTFQPP